jgi:hypothetical protein
MEEITGPCHRCGVEDILDETQHVCWDCWCVIGEYHETHDILELEEE